MNDKTSGDLSPHIQELLRAEKPQGPKDTGSFGLPNSPIVPRSGVGQKELAVDADDIGSELQPRDGTVEPSQVRIINPDPVHGNFPNFNQYLSTRRKVSS